MLKDKIIYKGVEYDKMYKGTELLYEVGPKSYRFTSSTLTGQGNAGSTTTLQFGSTGSWVPVVGE